MTIYDQPSPCQVKNLIARRPRHVSPKKIIVKVHETSGLNGMILLGVFTRLQGKTEITPVIAASLAGKAIRTRMLAEACCLLLGHVDFSHYMRLGNKGHSTGSLYALHGIFMLRTMAIPVNADSFRMMFPFARSKRILEKPRRLYYGLHELGLGKIHFPDNIGCCIISSSVRSG